MEKDRDDGVFAKEGDGSGGGGRDGAAGGATCFGGAGTRRVSMWPSSHVLFVAWCGGEAGEAEAGEAGEEEGETDARDVVTRRF